MEKNYQKHKRHVNLEQAEPAQYCKTSRLCGGCQLLHIPYTGQLAQKEKAIKEILAPFSPALVASIKGMDFPFFYRHKVQLPFGMHKGKIVLGCYEDETHKVIDNDDCLLQDRALTFIARSAAAWFRKNRYSVYNETNGEGILRHMLLRKGYGTGEILVGFITNSIDFPGSRNLAKHILNEFAQYPVKEKIQPHIAGIVQNINLRNTNVVLGERSHTVWGKDNIREKLGDFSFRISLESFFQVNPLQATFLFNTVKNISRLTGSETVVDAYAGTGTIALWLAGKAKKVILIEENTIAVKNARVAARHNNAGNIEFVTADAEDELNRGLKADVLVIDPPRKGCGEKVCKAILHSQPKRIIYVSCNPHSFAKDMEILKQGYSIVNVQPIDMFPHTEHVEMVCELIAR